MQFKRGMERHSALSTLSDAAPGIKNTRATRLRRAIAMLANSEGAGVLAAEPSAGVGALLALRKWIALPLMGRFRIRSQEL